MSTDVAAPETSSLAGWAPRVCEIPYAKLYQSVMDTAHDLTFQELPPALPHFYRVAVRLPHAP